jgi:hypothetical protein
LDFKARKLLHKGQVGVVAELRKPLKEVFQAEGTARQRPRSWKAPVNFALTMKTKVFPINREILNPWFLSPTWSYCTLLPISSLLTVFQPYGPPHCLQNFCIRAFAFAVPVAWRAVSLRCMWLLLLVLLRSHLSSRCFLSSLIKIAKSKLGSSGWHL